MSSTQPFTTSYSPIVFPKVTIVLVSTKNSYWKESHYPLCMVLVFFIFTKASVIRPPLSKNMLGSGDKIGYELAHFSKTIALHNLNCFCSLRPCVHVFVLKQDTLRSLSSLSPTLRMIKGAGGF